MCVYIFTYFQVHVYVCINTYLQRFILCVAGGVAVYDAVVCVAVCAAGCVAVGEEQ